MKVEAIEDRRKRQSLKDEKSVELAQVLVGLVLLCLVTGLWVRLWVPSSPNF